MSPATSLSSLDQLAALVRGVRLPLEPIGEEYLEIIIDGLADAFESARADAPTTIGTGNEAAVTALLEAHLKRRIEEDPLWRTIVAHVGRGIESVNYDGTKLEKRPDLSISLTATARSLRFPLIVEAKIIDCSTRKTVKLYCEKGVRRFQNGDYAWGCKEALMLAYVRDGSTLMSSLAPQLAVSDASGNAEFGTQMEPIPRASLAGDIALSQHNRSFSYLHQDPPGDMPGEIAIWHVWLA